MNVLAKAGKGFDQFMWGVGGALVIVLYVSSLSDVLTRIITHASLPWSHTLSIWCQISYTFLLVGPILWEGAHIGVDFIIKRLKGWVGVISYTIFAIALVTFCVISAYSAIAYIPVLMHFNLTTQIGIWYIPWWPVIAVSVAAGMIIAVPYSIAYLIRHIRVSLAGVEEVVISKEERAIRGAEEETKKKGED